MSNNASTDTSSSKAACTLPVGKYCGYGSCDRPPEHAGDHRCRCGRLVDAPGEGCAWHTAPTRPQLTVLAERDAARSAIHSALELHAPEQGEWTCSEDECAICQSGGAHEGEVCVQCTGFDVDDAVYPWPCPTVRALQGHVRSRVHLNASDGCAGFCCETITLRDGRMIGRCMLPEASDDRDRGTVTTYRCRDCGETWTWRNTPEGERGLAETQALHGGQLYPTDEGGNP